MPELKLDEDVNAEVTVKISGLRPIYITVPKRIAKTLAKRLTSKFTWKQE